MWLVLAVAALLFGAGALLVMAQAVLAAQNEKAESRLGQGLQADTAQDIAFSRDRLSRIKNPLVRTACRSFWSAGIDVSPKAVTLGLVFWPAFVVFATILWGVVGLVVAFLPVVVIWLVLGQIEQRRRRRINEQLPNFLGYLVRSLTAGNTLEEGLHHAALESSEPIRSVFSSVSRRIRLGADIEDTLSETAGVYRLRALHILAMSTRVNRRYGGSMRRIIATLIDTIRQQEEAAQELKSLTAETRFSAYVVAAIPIAISVFFYLQNPAYYASMLQSGGGRIAIMLALALEALGLLIIWRMMSRLKDPG